MRPREDELIDPEIAEQLDAIDATLAGDPVAPRFAELAELALLLSAGRPDGPRPEFAHELDRRVQARFGRVEPVAPTTGAVKNRRRRWSLTPALGAAGTALAALVVAVVVVAGGGAGSSSSSNSLAVTHASAGPRAAAAPVRAAGRASRPLRVPSAGNQSIAKAAGPGAQSPAVVRNAPSTAVVRNGTSGSGSGGNAVYGSASGGSAASSGAPIRSSASSTAASGTSARAPVTLAPQPIPNGRKITQSSMLELGAPAGRIDTVAQEVFDVVGAVDGIVESSNVSSTGGPGAGAQFQLRVPSPSLPQALAELSRLRYADVISRTDNTQDVNSSFVSAQRRIADARAALVRLRAKLAAATIETQIASLRRQIASENATISQSQASLRSLNRRVDYSSVNVSVQANTGGPSSGGGGFGLRKAGHDALRVLEITAGVALIALAALVPIGLLAALGWWAGLAVQRRRRERALDLA